MLVCWNSENIVYKKAGVEIINISLGKHKNCFGALFTFLNIIRFWHISAKIIKNINYDFVHCNDLNTLGILFFLKKEFGKKLIYDAHELFAERYSFNSIKYKIWNYIEKKLIRRTRCVITPELYRARYIKDKYKLAKMPYIINNFPRFQSFKPKNIKKELGIQDRSRILCYLGNLMPNRKIEIIIESLKYLPDNYVLVLFGYSYDNYIEKLNKLVKKNEMIHQVYFYGKLSPEEILPTIAQCDIGVALYENSSINNYYCAPNKVFEYIMAGVKVVANDYPSLRMLKKYGFVRLVSDISPEMIARNIKELIKDNSIITENVKRIFSWEKFNKIFAKIYS